MGDKDDVNVVQLYGNQREILSRLEQQEQITEKNHKENRQSIHSIRNLLQDMSNEIWKLKIKLAVYAGAGGAIAASVAKGVEYLLNHLK